MYDKVRVSFKGGTSTIVFVPRDDDMQEVLADLADVAGAEVVDYQIVETVSTEDTGFEDEDEDEDYSW